MIRGGGTAGPGRSRGDANRASEVIQRIRDLVKKTVLNRVWLDINDLIYEVVDLVQNEVRRGPHLTPGLPVMSTVTLPSPE